MTIPNAPPATDPAAQRRSRTWFLAVSVLIIGNFVYRLVVPAHEYPPRTTQVIEIGLDILLFVGLIGMRRQVPTLQAVFWIALGCAIGSLAIRLFGGDASWWTGHLAFTITPR